jgi:hypothetical protein
MKKIMFFLSFLFIMCLGCTEEEKQSVCEAVVHSHFFIEDWDPQSVYYVSFDVTNTGDNVITRVEVPYKAYFEDGTSIQGSAWCPVLTLAPGETIYDVQTFINPPSQNPYNPRYHRFEGYIVRHEFLDPIITCTN